MKLSGFSFRRHARLLSFVAILAMSVSMFGPLGSASGFERPQPVPLAAAASSVGVFPTSLTGGTQAMGEVFLSAPAPSGGATVNLSSNNPFVTVPKTVKVLERDLSATFNIKTKQVSATTTGIITASYGGQAPTASLTVNPAATTQITVGETNVTATPDNGNANLLIAQPVTLNQTGTVQSLSFYVTTAAGNLRLGVYDASGPGGIPGSKKAETSSFAVTTGWNTVNITTPVSLTAGSYYLTYLPSDNNLAFRKAVTGGTSYYYTYAFGAMPTTFSTSPSTTGSHWSLYGTLNVQTSGPVMSLLSVNPTTVTGGTSSQGTATLTAAAPSGGAVVSLSSTNPSVATGPASVVVPAGSLSATFTVSTSSVSASTSVSISGSYGGVSRSASLTVNPVAPPPDTTPPVISGVASSSITSSGATVSWATNEASNSQVDYGTTTAYGSSTALNSSMVTSHGSGLSGLTASTLYHYRVKSRDAAGNLGTSGDFTFTTAAADTTPPVISLVAAGSITSVGAVISWTTNEASNSQVDYGTTTSYGSSTVLDATLLTGHFSTLASLSGSTLYHYRVKSRDAAGNLATSGDFTFTTLAADVTPPVISAVASSSVNSSGATVTWSTNEGSNTQVDYGTTTSYGSSTTLDSSMVTSHSTGLSSLSANTLYHYRVKSRDAAGNLATSVDFTFTTTSGPASNTFYVATTGSDSNSCVAAKNSVTPKRTMAGASGCLAAGDTMQVSAGTYAESIGDSFTPTSGSDPSHKTVFKAAPGATVILRPSGVNRVVDLNGSSIANIEIRGFVMDSSLLASDTVKITGGSHDIDIISCDISMGSTPNPHIGMGVLISNNPPINQNVLIKDCVIHGNGNSTGSQDHQIYVSHTNNVTIDGCTFYDSTSHGVHVWDGGIGGCSNVIVRNCTAFRCDRGFGIYAGSGNILYNNIAYSNNYGIYLRNDGGTINSPAVYNNTLVSNAAYGLRIQSIAIGDALARNNLCYSNGTDLLDEATSILSNNLTGTNPNFVDMNGHNYHLTDSSTAAIDKGMSINTVFTTDKDGLLRAQQGLAWDIGAYER